MHRTLLKEIKWVNLHLTTCGVYLIAGYDNGYKEVAPAGGIIQRMLKDKSMREGDCLGCSKTKVVKLRKEGTMQNCNGVVGDTRWVEWLNEHPEDGGKCEECVRLGGTTMPSEKACPKLLPFKLPKPIRILGIPPSSINI